MLHTGVHRLPSGGLERRPSFLIPIPFISLDIRALNLSLPIGDTSCTAPELDSLELRDKDIDARLRWAASAMFLATPPRLIDTRPGIVDCTMRAGSVDGSPRAITSTAVAPTTRSCARGACMTPEGDDDGNVSDVMCRAEGLELRLWMLDSLEWVFEVEDPFHIQPTHNENVAYRLGVSLQVV